MDHLHFPISKKEITSVISFLGKGYFRLMPIWRQPAGSPYIATPSQFLPLSSFSAEGTKSRFRVVFRSYYSCRTERLAGLPSPLKTGNGSPRKNTTVVVRSMIWHRQAYSDYSTHLWAIRGLSLMSEEGPRGGAARWTSIVRMGRSLSSTWPATTSLSNTESRAGSDIFTSFLIILSSWLFLEFIFSYYFNYHYFNIKTIFNYFYCIF